MFMKWILGLVALGIGTLSPLKAGIDSSFAEHTTQAWAAMSSLVGALVIVLIAGVAAGQLSLPSSSTLSAIPWYLWLSSLCAIGFLAGGIFVAPKLGASYFIVLLVLGQVFMSLVLDHQGAFTFEQKSISWTRVIGALMVLGGVIVVQRG